MIIKGKDVIGLNVVTIDTGSVIQTVDDIAYDPTTQRIIALFVDRGGLFKSAKAILMDDVRNIGENAVIVHDASVIQSVKALEDEVRNISKSNKHLVRTNVMTNDGKELGKVTDIFFDSQTGAVDSMEVSQGGIKTLTEGKKSIKPGDIVTIGADTTLVTAYTELKLEAQGEQGGLKGAFNDAKGKVEEFGENAKEKIQDAADKTVKASKEFAADAREKTADFSDKATLKAEEVRDDLTVKAREARDVAADKIDDARDEIDRRSRDVRRTLNEKADDVRETAEKPDTPVVNQETTRYEDKNKIVKTKKSVVRK